MAVNWSDFEPFDVIAGARAVARDAGLRQLWCNERWAAAFGKSPEQLKGTRPADIWPGEAARERERFIASAIEAGEPRACQHLWDGVRTIAWVYPLRGEADGEGDGCFVLNLPGPAMDEAGETAKLTLLRSGTFGDLDVLSARELEVLYHIARGLREREIAESLFRSNKTVNKHVASIHRKLGLRSRGEVVGWFVERGLLGFTAEQWGKLIETRGRRDAED